MIYSCGGLSGADEHSHRNPVQWSCLILQDDKCGDGSLPADAKHPSQWAFSSPTLTPVAYSDFSNRR